MSILSGGSGTRLWPLSRAMYPKQFIRFFDDQQTSSFLAATLKRLGSEEGFAAPIVVCNNDHRFLVEEEAERAGVTPARHRARAGGAQHGAGRRGRRAAWSQRQDPAGILVVMPSDHAITDEPGFVSAVRRAAEVAAHGQARAVRHRAGARRTPATATSAAAHRSPASPGLCRRRFHGEARSGAPPRPTCDAGTYSWNSGIFVFGARAFLDELARLEPAILDAAQQALADASEDLGFLRLEAEAFARAPAHLHRLCRDGATRAPPPCCRSTSAGAMSGPGRRCGSSARTMRDGNAVHGDALLEDHEQLLRPFRDARSSPPSASSDLVIVDTPDALLVADRARRRTCPPSSPRLKAGQAARSTPSTCAATVPGATSRRSASRPRFQVKLLHVKPGAQAVHADAPPSLRALGGGARHGQDRPSAGRRSSCARTSPSTSSPPSGTGSRTPARLRWSSSRCRSAATSARTTSSAPTTSTTALPTRRSGAAPADAKGWCAPRLVQLSAWSRRSAHCRGQRRSAPC